MDVIYALVVGGLVGWVASKVMNTDAQQGIFLNIVVGCVGSVIGTFLFASYAPSAGLRNGIDIPSLVVAFLGSLILLAALNLIRRGRIR